LRERLVAAYAERRAGRIDETELGARLAAIRADIAALEILPAYRDALASAMEAQFGPAGTYGVFVRSDTNVEDLPQFTGAGLNETLPNVVDPQRQLTGITRVWSSVLSPRAIAWRSNLLTNPEDVYTSVLLMLSVPADKSGVLVTTDVTGRGDAGLTVSTAWGIGGAVSGEAAETVVLRGSGTELVSEAKTAYRRELDPAGGIRWRPAADGPVLTPAEQTALRQLAAEVAEKYVPVYDERGRERPWDIEFGFVAGELTLFQIRPLVERGPALADRIVRALAPAPAATATAVSLDEPPIESARSGAARNAERSNEFGTAGDVP
jgi:phosphoenolpyruvate synthase/pyruvate phosphate dikinase